MELRVLRYFLAVAAEQNISRAAESLHITQPTLSRQLADLEDEIGKKLFIRGRHFSLTEEGIMLRQRAQEVISLVDKIHADFQQTENISGTISIGSGVYSSSSFLMHSLEEFSLLYPNIHFEIYTNSADTLQEKLEQGILDFALLQEPIDISNYDFIRMHDKDVWGLLTRFDSPLAQKSFISRQDLCGRRLCSARRLLVRHEIENWLGDIRDLNIIAIHNLIDNALPLVIDGFADVITIEGAVLHYDPCKVTFRPFTPPLETSVVLVWKRFFPIFSAAKLFLNFIRNVHSRENHP
ncbi:MAG: LysR family transcriptional regulator [Selenomonadaceae bacterium]|nr:LysR family transcriptional regulator [Selenomonadaceae bacterium]